MIIKGDILKTSEMSKLHIVEVCGDVCFAYETVSSHFFLGEEPRMNYDLKVIEIKELLQYEKVGNEKHT